MGAPKFKTSELNSLYRQDASKTTSDQNLRDRQKIEALRERLNDLFQKDSSAGKKAALILEEWLKGKR